VASLEKEGAKGKKTGEKALSAVADPDPEGRQLAAVAEPLEEASNLLQVGKRDPLVSNSVLSDQIFKNCVSFGQAE